jgi:hypothetical protein
VRLRQCHLATTPPTPPLQGLPEHSPSHVIFASLCDTALLAGSLRKSRSAALVVCKGGSWPDALWAEVYADSPDKRENDKNHICTCLTPIVSSVLPKDLAKCSPAGGSSHIWENGNSDSVPFVSNVPRRRGHRLPGSSPACKAHM